MKNNNKIKMTTNITKTSLEVLPSKYHCWKLLIFDYKLKKKYISEHKYKNFVNSWCFNNKNAFTAIKVVYINGGVQVKNLKMVSLRFFYFKACQKFI